MEDVKRTPSLISLKVSVDVKGVGIRRELGGVEDVKGVSGRRKMGGWKT